MIKQPITDGSAIIEGDWTQDDVQQLYALLKYGTLPFGFRVIDVLAH